MLTPEFLNRTLTDEQQDILARLQAGAEQVGPTKAPVATFDIASQTQPLASGEKIDDNRAEVLQRLADLIIDSYLEWKRQ